MLNDSFEELVAFQRALKEIVASADTLYSKQHEEFFVGLEGRFVSFVDSMSALIYTVISSSLMITFRFACSVLVLSTSALEL